MTAQPGGAPHPTVGSLAGEATQLLDVVAAKLSALQAAREHQSAEPTATEPCAECGHVNGSAVTCSGCPLCRLLAVLRGERPEVTAALVDSAALLVSALRSIVPDSSGTSPTDPAGSRSHDNSETGAAASESATPEAQDSGKPFGQHAGQRSATHEHHFANPQTGVAGVQRIDIR